MFTKLAGSLNLGDEEPKPPTSALERAKSGLLSAVDTAKRGAKEVGKKTGLVDPTDDTDAEQGLMTEASGAVDEAMGEMKSLCPALTTKQRIYGAVGCMALGFVLDLFATLALLGGKRHIPEYATLYTLGNLVAIGGSAFVVGPCRQAKMMFKPVRRVACIIYLSTMVLTLIIAFTYPNALLLILLLTIQYCALIWYGASFIPFGRTCIIKCCKTAKNQAEKAVMDG